MVVRVNNGGLRWQNRVIRSTEQGRKGIYCGFFVDNQIVVKVKLLVYNKHGKCLDLLDISPVFNTDL